MSFKAYMELVFWGTFLMISVWYALVNQFSSRAGMLNGLQKNVLFFAILAFIFFGLSSSHFFSRPSITAIFITSLSIVFTNLARKKNDGWTNS
jgi:fucose permease